MTKKLVYKKHNRNKICAFLFIWLCVCVFGCHLAGPSGFTSRQLVMEQGRCCTLGWPFFTFSNDFGRKEEIDNDGLLFSLSSCQIQLKDISRVGFIFDYNYITFLLLAILILSTQKSKEREHAQAVWWIEMIPPLSDFSSLFSSLTFDVFWLVPPLPWQ